MTLTVLALTASVCHIDTRMRQAAYATALCDSSETHGRASRSHGCVPSLLRALAATCPMAHCASLQIKEVASADALSRAPACEHWRHMLECVVARTSDCGRW